MTVNVDHTIDPRHAVKSYWLPVDIWKDDEMFSQWLGTWFTDSFFFWEVVNTGELVLVEVFM